MARFERDVELRRRMIRELKDCVARIRARREVVAQISFLPPQAPPTHQLDFDPLITDRQKYMMSYYDLFGVHGLGKAIYHIALSEIQNEKDFKKRQLRLNAQAAATNSDSDSDEEFTGGHKSWQKIVADFQTPFTSRMMYYLCTLPPPLIPALIRGDLPSRLAEDQELCDQVEGHVRLRDTQGVYAIFVAAQSQSRSTQVLDGDDESTPAGRGLSLNQLKEVIEGMKLYTSIDNAASAAYAESVDQQKPGAKPLDYNKQRRYAGGSAKRNVDVLVGWVEEFEKEILQHWDRLSGLGEDEFLDIPMLRCFCYVGLGSNLLGRSPSHWIHRGNESPIFGLFTAICHYLFGARFSDLQVYTYQIFKTVMVEDIGFDEIIASVLLSAYPWDHGLSYTYAGVSTGASTDRTNPNYLAGLEKNAESIERSGFLKANLEDAEARGNRTLRLLNAQKTLQEDKARILGQRDALLKEIDDALREYSDVDDLNEDDPVTEEQMEAIRANDAREDQDRRDFEQLCAAASKLAAIEAEENKEREARLDDDLRKMIDDFQIDDDARKESPEL